VAVPEPSGLLVLAIGYLSVAGLTTAAISSVSQWLLDTELLYVYAHAVAVG